MDRKGFLGAPAVLVVPSLAHCSREWWTRYEWDGIHLIEYLVLSAVYNLT